MTRDDLFRDALDGKPPSSAWMKADEEDDWPAEEEEVDFADALAGGQPNSAWMQPDEEGDRHD